MSGVNDFFWQDHAKCRQREYKHMAKFFFSEEPREKHDAKNLCFSCDVRKECLKFALEHKELWGIWGGRDEDEIRRALSVTFEGKEIRRNRFPNCPYCSARPSKLEVLVAPSPEGGRWATMKLVHCKDCDFTWRSRTSANAVTAYHSMRERRKKRGRAKKST
jgi:WhiB family redox-sensing transcriptional regulator